MDAGSKTQVWYERLTPPQKTHLLRGQRVGLIRQAGASGIGLGGCRFGLFGGTAGGTAVEQAVVVGGKPVDKLNGTAIGLGALLYYPKGIQPVAEGIEHPIGGFAAQADAFRRSPATFLCPCQQRGYWAGKGDGGNVKGGGAYCVKTHPNALRKKTYFYP